MFDLRKELDDRGKEMLTGLEKASGIDILGPKEKYSYALAQFELDFMYLLESAKPEVDGVFERLLIWASSTAAFSDVSGLGDDSPALGDGELRSTVLEHNLSSLCASAFHHIGKCMDEHQLMYHNQGHALEMMHDVAWVSKEQGLSKPWQFFGAVAGLFHDAIFTHNRVSDEQASVDLLLAQLRPFMAYLGDENIEKHNILQAAARIAIVGGTLPTFYKIQNTSGQHTTVKPIIAPLWQFYCDYLASNEALECARTNNIVRLAQSMSVADIHRSLMPDLLAIYPVQAGMLAPANSRGPLSEIMDEYHADLISGGILLEVDSIPDADDFSKIVLTKLGQSMRFATENISKPGHNIAALGAKIRAYLLAPEPQDYPDLSHEELLSLRKQVFSGEQAFAQINLNGFANERQQFDLTPRFYQSSWNWHHDIYQKIKDLRDDELVQVVHSLLDNARQQQGM